MPNVFVGDPHAKALWRFESAPGLAVDDISGITLTNNGGASGDTTHFWEGTQSALFSGSNYLSITDANLPAGFPSKSTDTAKVFSFSFWLRLHAAGSNACPIGKMDYNGGHRSWAYMIQTQNLRFWWGTGSGTGGQWLDLAYNLVYDRPYHIATCIDGLNGAILVYIYDSVTGGTKIFQATSLGSLWIDTGPLIIGGTINSSNLNGNIDEVIFFDRLLNYFDSKFIREGIYPSPGNNFTYDPSCKAVWNFEPGALLADSKNNNTLVADYPDASPYSITNLRIQGNGGMGVNSYSSWEGCHITDANLSTGFPLKTGDTNNKITVCGWYANYAYGYGGYRGGIILAKCDDSNVKKGFQFTLDEPSWNGSGELSIWVGNGTGYQKFPSGIIVYDNQIIHYALEIDCNAPSVYLRVFFLDTTIVREFSAKPSVAIPNPDGYGFGVGTPSSCWGSGNGYHDQVIVFDRLLNFDDIDKIRNSGYGAVESPNNSISLTTCQALPKAVTSINSLTTCQELLACDPAMVPHSFSTCQAIPVPVIGSCKSLSIMQSLGQALPNICSSKSRIQEIILDGGDFFLIF